MEKICKNCKWWRTKSDTRGKCDSPDNKVRCMSSKALYPMLVDSQDIAYAIEDSVTYPEDFGCIFFEKAPWKEES